CCFVYARRNLASECFSQFRVDLRTRKNHVTRLFHCTLARIDEHDIFLHRVVVKLAPVGPARTDCVHVRSGLQPLPFQRGRLRTRASQNTTATPPPFFSNLPPASNSGRDLLCVFKRRTPHANLLKGPNEPQGFNMAARLHAAPENSETFSIR